MTPIVLFIDPALDHTPVAAALEGALDCRTQVAADDRRQVAALVTGIAPVGGDEVAPYPGLRMVLTCSTGVDHLDVGGLAGRGLIVCRIPSYCTDEVADHALACVLAGWRGLWTLNRGVRAGKWEPSAILRRFDAQRLGIIGLGRIGSRLAQRALALNIEVIGVDVAPTARPPAGVRLTTLAELLRTSDAVSLHLPGSPSQPPLLGAREIAMMKPGALLVNLSRASLTDLDAVIDALATGALGGAAYDVWPQEPPAPDDRRVDTPGLLLTPHVGWSSPQADAAWVAEAVDALQATLIRNQAPAGEVRRGTG